MQTVGEILQSEREKQNLSVKDIEAATSIRAIYITAIEENDYKVIPGEVYVKGFIRNYANTLGLDGSEMVSHYRRQQGQVPKQASAAAAPLQLPPELAVEVAQPEVASVEQVVPQRAVSRSGNGSIVKWALAAVAVAAVAGFAWGAINAGWFAPGQQDQGRAPNSSQTVPAPAAPTPPAAVVPSKSQHPIAVMVKFQGNCWTQVLADGKEIYQGIPKNGEVLSWDATKTLTLKLGNAAAAEVTYNGQPLGALGDKGEVVSKTFTAAKS